MPDNIIVMSYRVVTLKNTEEFGKRTNDGTGSSGAQGKPGKQCSIILSYHYQYKIVV